MRLIGLGLCGLAWLLLFIPVSLAGDNDAIVGLEKQLSRMEKEMKDMSAQLARLKKSGPVQEAPSGGGLLNQASQLEVVKTYLELLPDTQVRDNFFRTVYLVARVRVQNVGTNPARDIVVYASCPECSKLGWQPNGDLDKLSGTVKYLAPTDKEEISLTIAHRTLGVAQPHDTLALPKEVLVRVHEGGCKESVCPIEVLTNRTAVPVAPEGSGGTPVAEPFYRTHR